MTVATLLSQWYFYQQKCHNSSQIRCKVMMYATSIFFLLISLINIVCLEGRTQYGWQKQHVIHMSSDVLIVVCAQPNQV